MENATQPNITRELLQQHPELAVAIALVYAILFFYLIGFVFSWIYFGLRAKENKPLLEIAPWTPRAWGLADVLIALIAMVAAQIVFGRIGMNLLGVDLEELRATKGAIPIDLAMWLGIANVFAMIVAVGWVLVRHGVPISHVGFTSARIPHQLTIGLLVGLGSLPLIYVLMMLVSIGFKTQYTHPLINEITNNGTIRIYVMGFVTAAIIAPLTEEFLFRVILQGWLQSIPFKSAFASIVGGLDSIDNQPRVALLGADLASGDEFAKPMPDRASEAAQPYAAIEASNEQTDEREHTATPPIWPSIVTGVLFGLAHWGYGLSFIPLIALGIVLGLVYRATHSIWPCVLIHFMLNATSISMLGFAILLQRAAG